MKKILFALLLCLLGISEGQAQQITVLTPAGAATGTLYLSGDLLTLPISGQQYASFKLTTPSNLQGTGPTMQATTDGTNWQSASATASPLLPYCRRLNVISANPSTIDATSAANNVSAVWDCPLPSTVISVRLVSGAGNGTGAAYSLAPGTIYIPGMPVRATLYDVTEGSIGAGIPLTVLDVSGWTSMFYGIGTPTGQPAVLKPVDDLGAGPAGGGANVSIPATTTWAIGGIGLGALQNTAGHTASLMTAGASIPLPKRMSLQLIAGGTVSTGRIRLEVSR